MSRIKEFWCSWTHGGGHIKRDSQDRINWQCQKCGRWAEPVPLEQEQRMTNQDIVAHIIKHKRQHITDGSSCWCNPEINYVDPETGATVVVHKEPQ